jgi:transposase, IS5 family
MKPKNPRLTIPLFTADLNQCLNPNHPLVQLAGDIDWSVFEAAFGATYDAFDGRPGKPIRLLVGLHYLKAAYNESDESVIERWLDSPYWQYFCGFDRFQHTCPIDPSNLGRWRKRVGPEKMEALLQETIETAKRKKLITKTELERVNVDTTVQEKNIAFPTDAKLFHRMREVLVRESKKRGMKLRQSYERLSKIALLYQHRLRHAGKKRKAAAEVRRLKGYLRKVTRDVIRRADPADEELKELLLRAVQFLTQTRESEKKLYSVHETEVECIGKGKAHKKYEFGVKVGLVSTSRRNWIVGAQAFPGNPYDGHTLTAALDQMKRITGRMPDHAYVDKGYRGHGHEGPTEIHLAGQRVPRTMRAERRWMKRRSAIEPIIGHAKSDHRMDRNYLKGTLGDKLNALLAAAGFNIRKLIREYARIFLRPILECLLVLLSRRNPLESMLQSA